MDLTQHTCDAEVGKPGNYRVCMERAQYRSQYNYPPHTCLHYCEDHKSHSSDKKYASQTRARHVSIDRVG